jgi:hypothetical protein
MELLQGAALVDAPMTQDIGGKDYGKRTVRERQIVHRSCTDRPGTFGGRAHTSVGVEFQPEYRFVAIFMR